MTAELGSRDPESALKAAAARVVDWSGGTRIGESLKAYNDEWGTARADPRRDRRRPLRRLRARRPRPRRRELERLARQAFAVVRVNPLKGDAAYEPLAGGMSAALPHVDRFLPGHDVASLEALGTVLARH